MDAAFLHHRELVIRAALTARDDRTGMAHALAFRRGNARDETDYRLLHVVLDPARAFFLVAAADLADHDDRIGIRVVVEQLHHIDMLHAVDRIAADADAGRLPHAQRGELPDRLVSQRAGARYHADAALLVDVPRHDADLDFVRRNQPRTVRPDQYGALALHPVAR